MGAQEPAEPGRKGRLFGTRVFGQTGLMMKLHLPPCPSPALSHPPPLPPSPMALGEAAHPHGALDHQSMAGSPEQDGWEGSRAGNLGTLAKTNPG